MRPVRKGAVSVMAQGHGHRHTAPGQHEHEFEPQYGLPEVLPAGERILWQGSPDAWSLAVQRFHVRKLMVYFLAILTVRVATQISEGVAAGQALWGAVPILLLFALAVLLLGLMAWLTARGTVYTLTNRRVVMRIGVVLTLSLNLPLRRVTGAALRASSDAVGDISLQLGPVDRVAYLHLWPHARRWRFARPEPTLLCVRDAAAVAAQLTTAWRALQEDGAPAAPAAAAAEQVESPSRPHGLAPSLATS